VEPPESAVESGHSTYWVQDGILVERTRDMRFTREMVEDSFQVLRGLRGVSAMPFLFDIREWKGATTDAWLVAIQNTLDLFSAVAVLVESEESLSAIPSFPKAVGQLLVPVQFLTDENEAMDFLRGHVSPD
jgi:hypothetical protein